MRKILLLGTLCLSLGVSAEEVMKDSTIQEVLVTGTRDEAPVNSVPVSVTVVSHEKLAENFRPSVLPTLTEQVPGLFITSRNLLGYGVSTGAAGSMMVRGVGSGAQLLVLIDGQPQYAGLMGHPIPDAYQTMMAERVEVLRGPASVLYGSNAMGGVVNIITRQAQQDGQQTSFQLGAGSYGTLQGEAVNRLKYGRFSSVVGINYQRTDGHRANSNFASTAGFVKLGYELSDNWRLTGDVDLTHFLASNPGEETAPLLDNDSRITRGLASFSVQNRYDKTSGTLRAFYDWGHHNIDDGYAYGAAPKTYHYLHNDHIAGITWFQGASLFRGNRTTVGMDWQHFGGHAWNRNNNGTRTELADTTQNEVGAYLDFRQDVCSWLTLNAGVRADWHSQVGTEVVPQGGVTFRLTQQDALKAIVSKGFRNPIIREMYMFPPKNPDLKPERMMNYELAYTRHFASGARIGANVFLIKGENLINRIMSGGRPLNINTGDFTHCGLEIEGDCRITKHWSVNANYSYLHMKDPVAGAPEHKAYIGTNCTYGRFSLVMGLQHINNLYLTAGKDGLQSDFTLLNATASFRLLPELRIFAKGENLLAERYQTYLGFPMPKATFMGGVSIDI